MLSILNHRKLYKDLDSDTLKEIYYRVFHLTNEDMIIEKLKITRKVKNPHPKGFIRFVLSDRPVCDRKEREGGREG